MHRLILKTRAASAPILVFCTGLFLFSPRGQSQEILRSFTDIEVRLHSASRAAGIQTFKKGRLLQPINSSHPELPYQPVVLCRDIEVYFDENGVSDLVKFDGFCHGPGHLPVEDSSHFEWWVTRWSDPVIAKSAACDDALKAWTKHEVIGTRLPGDEKKQLLCRGTLDECRAEFNYMLLKDRRFRMDLRTLEDEKICHMAEYFQEPRTWTLRCDSTRWNSRRAP